MLHTITLQIEAPSPQKATALRTAAHNLLDADPDCTVVSCQNAKATITYTVVGVQDGERAEIEVEALDVDEAEAKAPAGFIVTTVTPSRGDHHGEEE